MLAASVLSNSKFAGGRGGVSEVRIRHCGTRDADTADVFLLFIAVVALIAGVFWAFRRFAGSRLGSNANRGRLPRLAVIDAAAVDGRRRLVLVRRDNVEHLIMIGGPSDIVIEPNIVRATPQRDPGQSRGPAATELPPRVPLPDADRWSDAGPDLPDLHEPVLPELPPRPARSRLRRGGPPARARAPDERPAGGSGARAGAAARARATVPTAAAQRAQRARDAAQRSLGAPRRAGPARRTADAPRAALPVEPIAKAPPTAAGRTSPGAASRRVDRLRRSEPGRNGAATRSRPAPAGQRHLRPRAAGRARSAGRSAPAARDA